jgi:DNA polymerase elongation subunit (family B)
MKILLLDIESSPNTAHVWGLWQQNVSINQLMESSYVLCYAAKWLGDEKIMFDSVHQSKPKAMLKGIHGLLNDADAVVHYNGTKFDIPTLNKEFLLHSFNPPSPYKQIDLLRVVRSNFRFPSNKLDYVAQRLNLGKKHEHEGHELWVKCMNGDKDAWKRMEKYNILYKMSFYLSRCITLCVLGLSLILITISLLTIMFALIVLRLVCRNEALRSLVPEPINAISVLLVELGRSLQNQSNRP